MKQATVLCMLVIAAAGVGYLLYQFGGSAISKPLISNVSGSGSFAILAQGQQSGSITDRANYRITTVEQYRSLWNMIYGGNGPTLPYVDFTKDEVLGVFDGSHSSNGYSVTVRTVQDTSGTRTVAILHLSPDSSCSLSNSATSPFVLVEVAKTDFLVTHAEQNETGPCPPSP